MKFLIYSCVRTFILYFNELLTTFNYYIQRCFQHYYNVQYLWLFLLKLPRNLIRFCSEMLFFHWHNHIRQVFYSDRWSWWYYDWRRDLECNVGITSSYSLVMDHKMWGYSTTLNWPWIHTRQLRIIWREEGEKWKLNSEHIFLFNISTELTLYIYYNFSNRPTDFSIGYFHWDKSIHW